MIHWTHLFWIVPLCVFIGVFLFALLEAARDRDDLREDEDDRTGSDH